MLAGLVEGFQQLALSDAGQLRLTIETMPLAATVHRILAPLAKRVGPGLTIAKALVDTMQGQMRCLPDHGHGALFEIDLPRAA